MKSSTLWFLGFIVCASLADLQAAQAQFRRGAFGVIRRQQNVQVEQAKQAAAMQKTYLKWYDKAQADAAATRAAHIADLQRKKAEAEVQRQARIEQNKERNADQAAPKSKSAAPLKE